ncbi:DUF3040 domain-containing protein [Streptomyces sp. NPDC048404]|uniref:DUF3040 domain-containing protein n=1 Tax=unclassified Streptomyces TaxID=2593676 RepID=UPI0034371D4C
MVAGTNGYPLSSREANILRQIETSLHGDARFRRRMRQLHRGERPSPGLRMSPVRSLGLLSGLSLTSMITAVQMSESALIVAFSALWAVTVVWGCAWVRGRLVRNTHR